MTRLRAGAATVGIVLALSVVASSVGAPLIAEPSTATSAPSGTLLVADLADETAAGGTPFPPG